MKYKPTKIKTFFVQSYSSRSGALVLDINNTEFLLYPKTALVMAEELKKMADKKSTSELDGKGK